MPEPVLPDILFYHSVIFFQYPCLSHRVPGANRPLSNPLGNFSPEHGVVIHKQHRIITVIPFAPVSGKLVYRQVLLVIGQGQNRRIPKVLVKAHRLFNTRSISFALPVPNTPIHALQLC